MYWTSSEQRTVDSKHCRMRNGCITDKNEYLLYKKWTKRLLNDHRTHMRYSTLTCPVDDRSPIRSNKHQQIHTRYLQDLERTRNGQTPYQLTSNVHPPDIFIRWRPIEFLNMPKTCQLVVPDKTDFI